MNLNEKIYIYRKGQVQQADGSLTETRTLKFTLGAKVVPMSGSERAMNLGTEAYSTHRFHVLQRDDILGSDVLVWRSTDYNIRFIANVGPKERYMFIDAERGGAM